MANKAEGDYDSKFAFDFVKLGFNLPTLVSAEHNEGLGDLYQALNERLPRTELEPTIPVPLLVQPVVPRHHPAPAIVDEIPATAMANGDDVALMAAAADREAVDVSMDEDIPPIKACQPSPRYFLFFSLSFFIFHLLLIIVIFFDFLLNGVHPVSHRW